MKHLLALLAIIAGLSIAGIAQAADPTWTINQLLSTGCESGETSFSVTFRHITSAIYARTTVDVAGLRYMDEHIDFPGGNQWGLFDEGLTGPGTGTWPMPSDTQITVHFMLADVDTDDVLFDREVILSQCNGGEIISNTLLVGHEEPPSQESGGSGSSGAGKPAGNLSDGRINNVPGLDVAAPVAIYQDAQGNITIYAIDPATGSGSLVAAVTKADLDAKGVPTGSNLVLVDTTANGLRVVVARLTTGEIQVNVGTSYAVVWTPGDPSTLHHVTP